MEMFSLDEIVLTRFCTVAALYGFQPSPAGATNCAFNVALLAAPAGTAARLDVAMSVTIAASSQ